METKCLAIQEYTSANLTDCLKRFRRGKILYPQSRRFIGSHRSTRMRFTASGRCLANARRRVRPESKAGDGFVFWIVHGRLPKTSAAVDSCVPPLKTEEGRAEARPYKGEMLVDFGLMRLSRRLGLELGVANGPSRRRGPRSIGRRLSSPACGEKREFAGRRVG